MDALRRSEAVLCAHPEAGHPYEGHADMRERKIAGTAFSPRHAEARGTVRVIDVRNQHGLRSAEILRAVTEKLCKRKED